jgi:phage tail sheath protein FI
MATQLSPGVNVTEFDLTTIVPAVGTTQGAIAGIFSWGPVGEAIQINSESTLVSTFGSPNQNNFQTWFTAANFLSYGNQLFVVRAANTTSGDANAALNAIANTGPVANVALCVVTNEAQFENVVSFDTNAMFIAKWPGGLGNSLLVSVCDSVNAYTSNVFLPNAVSSNAVVTTASINTGSNAVSLVMVGANGTQITAAVNTLISNFSVGDYIVLGNTSVGTQYSQIATISAPVLTTNATSNISTVSVGLTSKYIVSTDFSINSSAAANTNFITRFWEFQNVIGVPPQQTPYMATKTSNASIIDGMHVVIQDENGDFSGVPGTILETYTNLSRATDALTVGGVTNFWKTVLNQNSQYAWGVNDRPDHAANSAISTSLLSSSDSFPLTIAFNSGQDGVGESNASLATITNGYLKFQSTEDIDVSLILQGRPIGGATVALDGSGMQINNFLLSEWLIQNIAQFRLDCVVFITPDDAVITNNYNNEAVALINWRNILSSTSYALIDSGYKYQYDRYNDVYRWVPTNGDIAGLCVRNDSIGYPWDSPAGFNRGQINNVVKMRFNPALSDRNLLYPNGIDPVVTFPAQGTILYGDKTMLSQPSAFDRINVRRLFITIEKAISIAAKYTLFQLNDAFTRAAFVNMVTPYLAGIKALDGIFDFEVVCDTTNNTAQVIDSNQFVADIYVKPSRSINFIQLNFVAVPTGVAFAEVVGNFSG